MRTRTSTNTTATSDASRPHSVQSELTVDSRHAIAAENGRRSRRWRRGVLCDEEFPSERTSDYLDEEHCLDWIYSCDPDRQQLDRLAGRTRAAPARRRGLACTRGAVQGDPLRHPHLPDRLRHLLSGRRQGSGRYGVTAQGC